MSLKYCILGYKILNDRLWFVFNKCTPAVIYYNPVP